jgi:hypothetical protein
MKSKILVKNFSNLKIWKEFGGIFRVFSLLEPSHGWIIGLVL